MVAPYCWQMVMDCQYFSQRSIRIATLAAPHFWLVPEIHDL